MKTFDIGSVISASRKEKGATQEELAKFVGVSAQAVSKWENGGVPDTELLPRIADFFEMSIDKLFGRAETHNNLNLMIAKKLKKLDSDSRESFEEVLELCFVMTKALFGVDYEYDQSTIKSYEKRLSESEQEYSSIMTDYGFTRMGIANRLQYFLIVPEIKNKEAALFDGIDYLELFRDLSDRDIFNALVFLNKREHRKSFTSDLFVKNLNLELSKAEEVINRLSKYNLIKKTKIEIDDDIKDIYTFMPTPSFTAMLIFAREMIDKPNRFSYCSQSRNKPYLE